MAFHVLIVSLLIIWVTCAEKGIFRICDVRLFNGFTFVENLIIDRSLLTIESILSMPITINHFANCEATTLLDLSTQTICSVFKEYAVNLVLRMHPCAFAMGLFLRVNFTNIYSFTIRDDNVLDSSLCEPSETSFSFQSSSHAIRLSTQIGNVFDVRHVKFRLLWATADISH